MEQAIIPRVTCSRLIKILSAKDSPRDVTVKFNHGHMVFSWAGVIITTKLIDGAYPDYVRIIPTNNALEASFKPKQLLEGIAAVAIISSASACGIKFSFSKGKCGLMVKNPEAGNAEYNIDVAFDYPTEQNIDIGLNSKYITEAIMTACPDKSGTLTMKMNDSSFTVLLTGSQHGFIGLVMPMKV